MKYIPYMTHSDEIAILKEKKEKYLNDYFPYYLTKRQPLNDDSTPKKRDWIGI